MKRAGFTMIELIFVIVILGILAAVALPKFIGVSDQAHNQKVEAFIGTLNRTVGPSMWAQSLAQGNGGQVANSTTQLCGTQALLLVYVDSIPEEVTFSPTAGEECSFDANTTNGVTLGIDFTDGNATNSPTWTRATTGTGNKI